MLKGKYYYNILAADYSVEDLNDLANLASKFGIQRLEDTLFQADNYKAYNSLYKAIAKRKLGKATYFYRGKTKVWGNDLSWLNIAELCYYY